MFVNPIFIAITINDIESLIIVFMNILYSLMAAYSELPDMSVDSKKNRHSAFGNGMVIGVINGRYCTVYVWEGRFGKL